MLAAAAAVFPALLCVAPGLPPHDAPRPDGIGAGGEGGESAEGWRREKGRRKRRSDKRREGRKQTAGVDETKRME